MNTIKNIFILKKGKLEKIKNITRIFFLIRTFKYEQKLILKLKNLMVLPGVNCDISVLM